MKSDVKDAVMFVGHNLEHVYRALEYVGLSYRDRAALMAMQGMLAHGTSTATEDGRETVAKKAYAMADAMAAAGVTGPRITKRDAKLDEPAPKR